MANPVVHFELNARDAKKEQKFFADLFDWHVDTNNPQGYGMIDTHSNGNGIGGGVGASQSGRSFATFYVEVDDLQKYLDKAQKLGGKIVAPPMKMPQVEIALFADPEGNVIGLSKGM